jgi:hypothetical protein
MGSANLILFAKWTAVTSLGAPTLLSPANGATYQQWNSTKFTWSPVTDAITYHFQLSLSNTFATLVTEDSTRTAPGDTLQLYLSGSKAHYWRVRAKNADGAGDWSPTWSFTTTTQFEGKWEGSRKVNQDGWWYEFRNDTVRVDTLRLDFINDVMDTIPAFRGLFTFNPVDSNLDIQLMNADFSAPTGQTIKTLYYWRGGIGSFFVFEMMENDADAARPVDMSDVNKNITFYFKDF